MTDRIQYPFKNDHDIFIALIEDFNSSIASLDRRMVDDHSATLDIKALLQKQYQDLSTRIDTLEKELEELRPEDLAQVKKDVAYTKQWVMDFNRTKHIIWIIASTGFILMGFYLPQVILTFQKLFLGGK